MSIFDEKSNHKSSDYRSRNYSGNWVSHFINEYVDSLQTLGLQKTQSEFFKYKDEHLPRNLYKFFPPTIYSLLSLQNQTIFLSTPQNFNDPFDSYVCVETETYAKLYLLRELKRNNRITATETPSSISSKEYWEINNSWSKEDETNGRVIYSNRRSTFMTIYSIFENKNKDFKEYADRLLYKGRVECQRKIKNIRSLQFRISCFSDFKDDDELLQNSTMWSHYADNHRGFCIKYSIDFENLDDKELIVSGLFPVKYTSVVPKISSKELLKLEFEEGKLKLNKSVIKTTLKTLTTKSRFWKYENEWRLILSEQSSLAFPKNTIKFFNIEAIFLGCRIEKNLRNEIIKFGASEGISVFQTTQSNEKFNLHSQYEDITKLKTDEFYEKLDCIDKIEDLEFKNHLRDKLYTYFNP
ncbi:DUF2971 domain-containing protein [Sinomicrobium pectinilyticum]|uniref:DUF2971 domain-containing protein n=1 Tax=Sinomicrobium pectinilyticum TaxID=1084421 RepID=A0A3N0EQB7_SINP1|nr:DUF2971 domain-containing protein [Sinomicrobium pectinilyticum]RNL90096.1 DUF2971 domain-containing protein [Sinomicrobium pectinilyticum]